MSSQTEKPIYIATPAQNRFHRSGSKFRLYGGAAGAGKSIAILFEAVALAQFTPNSHILLMRRSYPDLKMSLILKALEMLPLNLYKYHASDHVLTWLPTKSRIQFGHADREEDVYRYQGAEFDYIGVDELTQHSEKVIKFLWSRMRTSKPGVKTKFFGATNPGGIGHKFVKRLWIDKQLTKDELAAGYTAEDFEFIPGRVEDNPYMDKSYIANLMMMPENQRKMFLEGSWDVYEGRFFEEFNEYTHLVEPFTPPDSWLKFRAIDFGRTAPFACLWIALDHNGEVYVYREYYAAGREVDENVDAVLKLSEGESYRYSVVDTAVFSKTGFGETIGQRMQRKGLSLVPAHKDRVAGWTALKQYLHPKEGKPRIHISKACPSLIEEFTGAIYAKGGTQEDLDSTLPDHALDALRYFIMTLRDKTAPEPTAEEYVGVNKLLKQRFALRNKQDIGSMYNPYG